MAGGKMVKFARKGSKKATGTDKIVKAIKQNTRKTISADAGIMHLSKQMKKHNFTRRLTKAVTLVNPASTSDLVGIGSWQLTQVPNYSEFVALFDKYKMNYVDITVRIVDMDETGKMPPIFLWKNNDSDLAAGSVNQQYVDQLQYVTMLQPTTDNRVLKRRVYPYILEQVYSSVAGVGSTGYGNQATKYAPYIDISYPNVRNYGWAVYIPSVTGSLSTQLQVEIDFEFNLSFKDLV